MYHVCSYCETCRTQQQRQQNKSSSMFTFCCKKKPSCLLNAEMRNYKRENLRSAASKQRISCNFEFINQLIVMYEMSGWDDRLIVALVQH